ALALDLLYGSERVEGLAGLAHRDIERVRLDHRVAIAELGGGLGARRQARELLDHLRAEQPRDKGGAAAQDLDAAHVQQLARRHLDAVYAAGLEARLEPPAQRAAHRVRLLLDLLPHVM